MNPDTLTAFPPPCPTGNRPHRTAEPPVGPYGARLLHGWYETGGPADLAEHLGRYGPTPLDDARRTLVHAVDRSGLTGRGGGGFPTGRKLRAVAEGRGTAVVVANGMESEPASRKDEMLLSVAPHLVLDGAVLAATAVGADVVHLCVPRNGEQRLRHLRQAVGERLRAGTDPVRIEVHGLPHHFVSSEETALVNWLNGGDARPQHTPPRPFEKGVGKRPTLVDNVETLAHVALIARYGPAWFREQGTAETPGTALTTVSGAVGSPGVYEGPMGGPVQQALGLAGGPNRPLSAVLAGGFFGNWLPVPLDANAPVRGAGVLVALPEGACGLAETASAMAYLAAQSAQQCGPCRFGLPSVAEDFAKLAWARPTRSLLDRLHGRLGVLPGRGGCRHPDGAARLAASALEVFAEDVRRHQRSGPCGGARNALVLPVPAAGPPARGEWQ